MGKTFNATVDWLGMVENPDQNVDPSVNGEKAQAGTELSMCSNGEWNGESVKTGCGYRDSAHNLYGSAGLTLSDISDKSMSGSARAGLGYSTHIPYSPVTGHLGLSGGTRLKGDEQSMMFNPILDATGSVGIEGEFGGNSYNWREPWKYGAGIYGRHDLVGGTGTTAGLYGNVGLLSGKVGYNPNTGAEATIGFGLPIRQKGGDYPTQADIDEFHKLNNENYLEVQRQAVGNNINELLEHNVDMWRPDVSKYEKLNPLKNCWYDNTCVEAVKNGYKWAGYDAGIPDDVYDNETFFKNYKDYGFDLIDIKDENDIKKGDILQYYTEAAQHDFSENHWTDRRILGIDDDNPIVNFPENQFHMGIYMGDGMYWGDGSKDEPTLVSDIYKHEDGTDKNKFRVFRKKKAVHLSKKQDGGSLPKFQNVGEKNEHLGKIDLTEINKLNSEKINSATYRERLRNEYQRAHNKTLSEAELDEMVSKLNVQLTQGENDGNTARYITKSPDPNALGFMVDGYGRIREEGMTTTPYEWSNYPNDFSKGNIYMSAYAGNNPYYTTNNTMGYRESDNFPLGHTGALDTQNSILNHEVNHRLNILNGTPLSSGADPSSDEYKQSAAYHNSFFSNAGITNPYHPDFENTEFGNYAKQPYEIKSQKAQLEQALLHAGIWDPNEGEFTQDHVDKLVDSGFTIPEEGGLDYLYKGLGIDKIVNPTGSTEIPINMMTDVAGNNPNNIINSNSYSNLTNAGYNTYIGTDRQKDGRMNINTTSYEGAKRRIDNKDYGSKELQDWKKKQQVLNTATRRSRSDFRNFKNVLEYGVNDEVYDDELEILKTHGITPSGPNNTLTEADIIKINDVNTSLQDAYNNDKELSDAGDDVQPSERGADKAYNKQKKIELDRVNKRHNENIESWDDVDDHRSWKGWNNDNRFKYYEDNTGHTDFIQGIDDDIEMAQNWISTYGGYDNVAAWKAAVESGDATQFNPRTRSNINYNTDVANAYMLDNSYTPPNQYNDGWGYGEEGDRDQYNTNYNTAISNNVWPQNQHTQAVMSLPVSQRDAMMWYYGDENKAPTTPDEFKEYHRKLKIVKSAAPNIRDWYINSANTNNQYISEQNEIYNENLQKINNSNTLQKKKTNEEVVPNLIDFMNNVADASEEIPQGNQYGISDEDMGNPLLSKYGRELPIAQNGFDFSNSFDYSPEAIAERQSRSWKEKKDLGMSQLGYNPGEEKDLAMDVGAMFHPGFDFAHAVTKANEGEYTDAALYAMFGILPFSAGPLVKGTKKAFNYLKNTNPLGKNAKIAKELSETLDAATLRNTTSKVDKKIIPVESKKYLEGKDINLSTKQVKESLDNEAFVNQAKIFNSPDKLPLTRVLDSKGLTIKDGKLFSKTGDNYFSPEFTNSRNTTHWSYGHIGDPGHGSWSSKSTAIINDFDNLKKSGHAMDLDPTDTYFYTKGDFEIPSNSLILTRDKKLYNKIKKESNITNIKLFENTPNDEFEVIVNSYSTKGPKKYNYQGDLFNQYIHKNWEQGIDVAQYKPARYLDFSKSKGIKDHFGGGSSKMHSVDPTFNIESIGGLGYRKNHGLYSQIETWPGMRDFGKGIGSLDAMLEFPKPMQIFEMDKFLRLYKNKPEALKIQKQLAEMNGFKSYKEFKESVDMTNFKKYGGSLSKAQNGTETERQKYIQFALDTESGYDYIRAKDSAVKKLGADGKWDGKTYYKIFEDGKYYPHYVGDEKRATIGHGHNPVDRDILDEYKDGINENQALDLLDDDIDEKLRLSEIYYNQRFGDNKWNDLTESEQFMLNDYTFNVKGGFNKTFKNFAKSIHDKDFKLANKEYKRALGERNEIFMSTYLKPWMDVQKEKIAVAPALEDMPLPIGTQPMDMTEPEPEKKETSWWRGEEGIIPDELELPLFMDGAGVNAKGSGASSAIDIPDGGAAENAAMTRTAMPQMPSLNNDLTINDNLALSNTITDLGEDTPIAKYGGQYMWGLDLRSTKAKAGKEIKSDDIYANDRYSQSASKYKKMVPKYQSKGEKNNDGLWNSFKKSDVGRFVDARGFERTFGMEQGIAGTIGKHFGYGKDEGTDMALDATAIVHPGADFVNAGHHYNKGEYTDATLYGLYGILPFTAGPLVSATKKHILNPIKNWWDDGVQGVVGQSKTHTYNPATKSWVENNAPKVQQKILQNDIEYIAKQDYLTNKITKLQQGKIKITEEIKQFKINNPGKTVPKDLTKVDNVINSQLDAYGKKLDNVPSEYKDWDGINHTMPTLESGNNNIIKKLNKELEAAEKLDLDRIVGDYKWDDRNIFKRFFDTPKHPFNIEELYTKPFYLDY